MESYYRWDTLNRSLPNPHLLLGPGQARPGPLKERLCSPLSLSPRSCAGYGSSQLGAPFISPTLRLSLSLHARKEALSFQQHLYALHGTVFPNFCPLLPWPQPTHHVPLESKLFPIASILGGIGDRRCSACCSLPSVPLQPAASTDNRHVAKCPSAMAVPHPSHQAPCAHASYVCARCWAWAGG